MSSPNTRRRSRSRSRSDSDRKSPSPAKDISRSPSPEFLEFDEYVNEDLSFPSPPIIRDSKSPIRSSPEDHSKVGIVIRETDELKPIDLNKKPVRSCLAKRRRDRKLSVRWIDRLV